VRLFLLWEDVSSRWNRRLDWRRSNSAMSEVWNRLCYWVSVGVSY